MRSNKQAPSGFTLLETMIVIAILGMTIFAVPSMSHWTRQDAGFAVDQFCADVQLARMMAIKHRRNCAVVIGAPGPNQYMNSLTRSWTGLSAFRGGVHFLDQGPDGRVAASQIIFNRQGLSTSVVPQEVFVADGGLTRIFRIRVMLAGGINVQRWAGERWQ